MSELSLLQKRKIANTKQFEPLFKDPAVQAYTMISLSLFTIAFFGFLAIRPTLKTIVVLNRQIEDKAAINQKLDDKINTLIKAQEEYQKLQPLLPTIYTLLPDAPDFPLLVRKLELLTENKEATLSGIQFSPIILYGNAPQPVPAQVEQPAKQEATTAQPSPAVTIREVPLTPISFTLSYGGTYQNLVSLLERLTTFDRLITIETIRLQKDQQVKITVGVSTNAYYYPTE